MRRIDELEIQKSEIRAQLADPDSVLKPSEETELRRKLAQAERDHAAEVLKAAEAREKLDGDRQFIELRDRIEARNYVSAALTGAVLSGREAEFNKELKLADVNTMPFEAVLDRAEERADVVADVSGADPNKPRMPVLQRVFIRSDSAWCGIQFPSVTAGEPNYPVLTSGGSGQGNLAAEAAIEGEAVTLEGHSVEPSRKGIRYRIAAESLAKYGSDTEDLLRRDAREALTKLIDDQCISGDGTGENLSGLIGAAANIDSVGAADPGAVSVPVDIDAIMAGRIDGGPYAYDASEIKLLIGKESYQYLTKNRVNGAAAGDKSGPRYLDLLTKGTPAPQGMIRASTRVPAPASNIQKCFSIRERELRALCPVWSSIQLIRDPYTDSAKSILNLTMIVMLGFKVIRGKTQERRLKLA